MGFLLTVSLLQHCDTIFRRSPKAGRTRDVNITAEEGACTHAHASSFFRQRQNTGIASQIINTSSRMNREVLRRSSVHLPASAFLGQYKTARKEHSQNKYNYWTSVYSLNYMILANVHQILRGQPVLQVQFDVCKRQKEHLNLRNC